MFRSAIVALAALSSSPAFAQDDIWTERHLPDGRSIYECGNSCEAEKMACIVEVVPELKGVPLEQYVATAAWGELDHALISEADGEFPAFQIIGGERLHGPSVINFIGKAVLQAEYDLVSADYDDVAATMIIWPTKQGLNFLRCVTHVTDDADGLLQSLVIKLRDGN